MSFLSQVNNHLAGARLRLKSSRRKIAGEYRRIYHYHVRKTAGSSLNSAFWGLVGLDFRRLEAHKRVRRDGLDFVRHHYSLIQRGAFFYASSHAAAHVLRPPPETFTVTVLRDPVSRLVSHYRNLLWVRDDPRGRYEERHFIEYLERKEFMWLGNSFGEFLERIPREHALRQLYMFSADYDIQEATEQILACSAVCFTETFNQDVDALSRTLQLPLHVVHERRSVVEASPSPTELARARELLEPEYELLADVRRGLRRVYH
jgi:hypothetical protein